MIFHLKVIINDKIYEMTRLDCKALLKAAKKLASECSIYALKAHGIVELTNKSYKSKSSLKRAIKRFEDEGFKVYYKE